MAIHAVVGGVELAPDEPFPEGWITGVERSMPILVPVQHVGVLPETFGILVFAEPVENVGISQIGLADKFGGGILIFLSPPMDRDLSLAGLDHLLFLTNISHIELPLNYQSSLKIRKFVPHR